MFRSLAIIVSLYPLSVYADQYLIQEETAARDFNLDSDSKCEITLQEIDIYSVTESMERLDFESLSYTCRQKIFEGLSTINSNAQDTEENHIRSYIYKGLYIIDVDIEDLM
jgi:hypothetical protein